jgi:hypothetical protein
MKRLPWILVASTLLISCSTKDENTLVGSEFLGRRNWASPSATDSLTRVLQDTYFEASTSPGTREDLLVGERRTFRFWTAVFFDTLPSGDAALVSARLTAAPWYADGSGSVRIARIREGWSESSDQETLDVYDADPVEAVLGPGIDAEIPVAWVRSWIDSSEGNHGVLIRPLEPVTGFFRFPAREDDSSAVGERFRLRIALEGEGGADSVFASGAGLDRFYAWKDPEISTVLANMDAETLLVGNRESMPNQVLFEILFPEELRDVTVNQAELVLTAAEVSLDEDGTFQLYASPVTNDTLAADSIVYSSSLMGLAAVPAELAPGDTVAIRITDAVRGYFADRLWERRIVVRASVDGTRDTRVGFYANEPSVAEGLRPRVRLLYTPLRPDEE